MIILVQGRPDQQVNPTGFYVYVSDVVAIYQQALAAGGVSTMEPADQFYGDRGAGFRDPAGNDWWLATRIEDLSSDDLARRIADPDFKRH
jgi:PhnB protein